ncbi:NAD(P)-binding protein [Aspergillus indologenus CBS 114.80]|uniref:NAD(P)-binding protein n=1 Tax=Aspergillus indologenus CBS 114.80 TaxID=1450541 RepID=A0A2V5I9C0_9EURO|nr:NAD(P)-binding protein [Aspergillus indologenus CBS 114.80]
MTTNLWFSARFIRPRAIRPLTWHSVRLSSTAQTSIKHPLPDGPAQQQRFREFNLDGKVFAVTGGGRGLGLSMAEALVEAGGEVHCLDLLPTPHADFHAAQARASPDFGGGLHYTSLDVRDRPATETALASIAARRNRLDGVIVAAGINHIADALDYTDHDIARIIDTNYTGVFYTATAAGRQMLAHRTRGSILLVASMSGLIANKGMYSSIYNSSKAAVVQLGRSLAMEWAKVDGDGSGGVRVNALCPGHVVTPMAHMAIDRDPATKRLWETENMMGRLGRPEEFRGLALLMMSEASSFMTGATLVCDGGHTAW